MAKRVDLNITMKGSIILRVYRMAKMYKLDASHRRVTVGYTEALTRMSL